MIVALLTSASMLSAIWFQPRPAPNALPLTPTATAPPMARMLDLSVAVIDALPLFDVTSAFLTSATRPTAFSRLKTLLLLDRMLMPMVKAAAVAPAAVVTPAETPIAVILSLLVALTVRSPASTSDERRALPKTPAVVSPAS